MATQCMVGRKAFQDNAKQQTLVIGNSSVPADPKEFSTGSFGWYANGRVTLTVDGQKVECMVGCTLTVIGSKDAK